MVLNRKISTKKRLSSSKKRRLAKKISRRRQNGGGYKYCMIKINGFEHGKSATFGHCDENIAQHLTPKQITLLEDILITLNVNQKYQYLFGYILQLCGYYAYRYDKVSIPDPYAINISDKIDGIMYNVLILMFILLNNIMNDITEKKIIITDLNDLLNKQVFNLLLGREIDLRNCKIPDNDEDSIFNYLICVIDQCLKYIKDNPEKKFQLPNETVFIKGDTLKKLKTKTFIQIISPLMIVSDKSVGLKRYIKYMIIIQKNTLEDIYIDIYNYLKKYLSSEAKTTEEKNIYNYISNKFNIPRVIIEDPADNENI